MNITPNFFRNAFFIAVLYCETINNIDLRNQGQENSLRNIPGKSDLHYCWICRELTSIELFLPSIMTNRQFLSFRARVLAKLIKGHFSKIILNYTTDVTQHAFCMEM